MINRALRLPHVSENHPTEIKSHIPVLEVDPDEQSHKETVNYFEKTSVYWLFVFEFAKTSHFAGLSDW